MNIELVNSSSKFSHIKINNNLKKLNNIQSLNKYRKNLVKLNKNINNFNFSDSLYIKTLETVKEKLDELQYESDYIEKELTEFKKLLNSSDVSNQNLNKSFNYRKKLNNYKNISKITDINNLKSKFNKKIVKKLENNIDNLDSLIQIILKTYDILIKLSDNNKPEQDKIEFIKKLKDDLEKLKNIKPNSAELSKNQNLALLLSINKLKKSIIAKINERIIFKKKYDIAQRFYMISVIINKLLEQSNSSSKIFNTFFSKKTVDKEKTENYNNLFNLLKNLIEDDFNFLTEQNKKYIDGIIDDINIIHEKIIINSNSKLEMNKLIQLYNEKKSAINKI